MLYKTNFCNIKLIKKNVTSCYDIELENIKLVRHLKNKINNVSKF